MWEMEKWGNKLRTCKCCAAFLVLAGLIALIGFSRAYANGTIGTCGVVYGELTSDGKITIEYPASSRSECVRLLVLDSDGYELCNEIITESTEVELIDGDVYGGDSADFYAVFLDEADLIDSGFGDYEAALDKTQEDTWEYKWTDSKGSVHSFNIEKYIAARPVERSLHVYKSTETLISNYGKSVSDADAYFSKYKVGENDAELIFEVTTNEEDFEISRIVFEGSQPVQPKPSEKNKEGTESTFIYTASLCGLTISEGEIEFTLQTNKDDTITYTDSNNGSGEEKVTYVGASEVQDLKIETLSVLVGAGDTVRLPFNTDYRIVSISDGSDYEVNYEEGYIKVVLSEGYYKHNERISMTVTAIDAAGNKVILELTDGPIFVDPDTADVSSLQLDNKDKIQDDNGDLYIQDGDELYFTLTLTPSGENHLYNSVVLKVGGYECEGYDDYYEGSLHIFKFKLNTADAASFQGWSDGDELSIEILGVGRDWDANDKSPVSIDNFHFESDDGQSPVYYLGAFEITGLQAELIYALNGVSSADTGTLPEFIIVDGDRVAITITLKHAVTYDSLDLYIGGSHAKEWEYMDGQSSSELRGAYYKIVDENGKKVNSGVTIMINLYMPHSGQADYYDDGVRLGVQKSGANEDYLNISLKAGRVHGRSVEASTESWPENSSQLGGDFHILKYWAPLTIAVGLDYNKYNDDNLDASDIYGIVKDGNELNLHFTANHDARPDEITTTLSTKKDGQTGTGNTSVGCTYTQSGNVYSTVLTVGSGALTSISDQAVMRLSLKITDLRGQTVNFSAGSDSDTIQWPIYYAPLQVSDVTITSSNINDGNVYCKDGDTVTVAFTTNHYVTLESSIIGKPIEVENRRSRTQTSYSFSYTLENGDVIDLAGIAFAFNATDLAGDSIEYTDASGGVINRLKYYAPIEATASITSNNPNPIYVKNGDTVTVSSAASHETMALDFGISGRTIGSYENFETSHTLAYRIPDNENELYEGDVFFSVRLEDPAGNYALVSDVNDDGDDGAKVIYDRTAPKIQISPAFSGYTNQDVRLSFIYSDLYLDMSTISCVLNGTEKIRNGSGAETFFEYQVELTEEGEYVISATVADMAGNEVEFSAVCTFIIDKTNPVIHIELARNTFQTGFTLDRIIYIEEDNLSALVCTISDSQGVYDWLLDEPIEDDGKKAVSLMARDMANNVSTPITYDIYIDGKAPQPYVACDGEEFKPTGKNYAVGDNNTIEISLAKMHIGDEDPDSFTTLRLVDAEGNTVIDFLDNPSEGDTYTYDLDEYGTYTLLLSAVDDVGNDTGSMMYLIEYREQYLLEQLLEGTPLAGSSLLNHITDTVLLVICIVLILLLAGITVFIVLRRRRKKKISEQEYIIIDDKE